MKFCMRAVLFLSVSLSLMPFAARAQTIMPFGDSVTANGSAPESSYRYWLWHYLADAGYNVDFIGTRSGVADGAPANQDFDQDYEGGDGWTSSDALWAAQHGVAQENPDIVLLDFGANDIIDGTDPSIVTTNLELIIEAFRAVNPNVVILMAKPTPWQTEDKAEKKAMSELKGAIKNAVKAEKLAGANVTLVNLAGSFNVRTDTKDGTHPNVRGEQKIAKKYFSAIKKVLKNF